MADALAQQHRALGARELLAAHLGEHALDLVDVEARAPVEVVQLEDELAQPVARERVVVPHRDDELLEVDRAATVDVDGLDQ